MTRYDDHDDNSETGRGRGRGRGAGDGSDEEEGPTTTTNNNPHVVVLELQSSLAFGVGSLLLIADSSFVRAVASCLLALHVVPEMCLDAKSSSPNRNRRRTYPHGRYLATDDNDNDDEECTSSSCGSAPQENRRRWNQAQSATFLVASVAQAAGYGFLLQIHRQPWVLDAYQVLNLAAASMWMVSGLMIGVIAGARTCRTFGMEEGRRRWCCCRTIDAGFVFWGNASYVLGCVCWLTAAVNQYRSYNEAYLAGYLQSLGAGLWSVAAVMFVVGDGRRLCDCGGRARRKPPSRGPRRHGDGAAEQRRDNVHETSSSSGGGDNEEDDDEA